MTYKLYSIEYPYAGSRWSFEIYATSHEDAEERVRAMAFATVGGEIVEKIPAWIPGAGWYMRLRCWLGNRRSAL